MGDFNAQIGKRQIPVATGKCGLGFRKEKGDTLVEWATSRKYKIINTMIQKYTIMNTMFQKKAWRRWTWKCPNGIAKTAVFELQQMPKELAE